MRRAVIALTMILALGMGAGQAFAFGAGDPVGLIGSGGLLPFRSAGGSVTVAEFTSPVSAIPNFHIVFFNATCTRTISKSVPLTTNDVEVVSTLGLGSGLIDGLIAFATTGAQGTELRPFDPGYAVGARAHEINLAKDYIRVIDAIGLDHAEIAGQLQTWNPMRTGAAFWAPTEGASFSTDLYIVCPGSAIQGSGGGTSGAVSAGAGFPNLTPDSAANFGSSDTTSGIAGVIFDDDEEFIADITITCNCLTVTTLTQITVIYGDLGALPNGSYTELLGGNPNDPTQARSFYLARGIQAKDASLAGGQLDSYGRTLNGNRLSIGGVSDSYPVTQDQR